MKFQFGWGQKQRALTMVWTKNGTQHLGRSIRSLRSCIVLDDLEISVNPNKSEIMLNNLGYSLIVLDNVGWILES